MVYQGLIPNQDEMPHDKKICRESLTQLTQLREKLRTESVVDGPSVTGCLEKTAQLSAYRGGIVVET